MGQAIDSAHQPRGFARQVLEYPSISLAVTGEREHVLSACSAQRSLDDRLRGQSGRSDHSTSHSSGTPSEPSSSDLGQMHDSVYTPATSAFSTPDLSAGLKDPMSDLAIYDEPHTPITHRRGASAGSDLLTIPVSPVVCQSPESTVTSSTSTAEANDHLSPLPDHSPNLQARPVFSARTTIPASPNRPPLHLHQPWVPVSSRVALPILSTRSFPTSTRCFPNRLPAIDPVRQHAVRQRILPFGLFTATCPVDTAGPFRWIIAPNSCRTIRSLFSTDPGDTSQGSGIRRVHLKQDPLHRVLVKVVAVPASVILAPFLHLMVRSPLPEPSPSLPPARDHRAPRPNPAVPRI